MVERPPTYLLHQDFREKLQALNKSHHKPREYFRKELASVDAFVQMANADKSERDDHDLRRTGYNQYVDDLLTIRKLDLKNQTAFNSARHTVIIMPDCLSIHDTACDKTDHKRGDICRRCRVDCQARQVVDLGVRYRVRAVFSKKKLAEQIGYFRNRMGDIAVVGIACILMLAEGMKVAAELGVPVRGVPLRFTGCDHWNDVTFTSELSMPWLESILEEKYGR